MNPGQISDAAQIQDARYKLLDTNEAAQYLSLRPATLRQWRHSSNEWLKYVTIGKRSIRYRLSDLQAFIDLQG